MFAKFVYFCEKWTMNNETVTFRYTDEVSPEFSTRRSYLLGGGGGGQIDIAKSEVYTKYLSSRAEESARGGAGGGCNLLIS